MMTPQEVAGRSFAKATLGGYNLAMVDEFLDALTADYTALYNENTVLKNKLKVLSETLEEYRATDNAMRKTLLAAQQMADAIVEEAKKKRDELVSEAEHNAQARSLELNKAVAAEEYRLHRAKESTAAYLRKLVGLHNQEADFLAGLGTLVPPDAAAQDDPASDIREAVEAQVYRDGKPPAPDPEAQPAPPVEAAAPPQPPASGGEEMELDPEATRRFSDIQFGRDYKIE